MRIVSLLPSATEIVCLLNLSDQLVGVSADSDWPAEVVERLPVLNTVSIDTQNMTSREIDSAASGGHSGASLYHVDPDLLRSLRPDLILTQEICEVCAVSRVPSTVLDPAVGALRERLDRVRTGAHGVARPRVFCMEWLDPPYTAGHWVPEMVELAGGRDELGTPAGPSRQIAWSDVVDYAPEVLVLMPCSLELNRVAAEFDLLRGLPDWQTLPAVVSGRVYAGHTHLFSRSGPRLVDGVEALARMLHPERFEAPLPPDQALKVSLDGSRLEPYR